VGLGCFGVYGVSISDEFGEGVVVGEVGTIWGGMEGNERCVEYIMNSRYPFIHSFEKDTLCFVLHPALPSNLRIGMNQTTGAKF